jgi:hypothetical protein
MALADVQRLLTRLVTDSELREAFIRNPDSTAAALRLDPDAARTLSAISPRQLRHYGVSLMSKRRQDVAKCLGLTARLLGPDQFDALFRRHAAVYCSRAGRRHTDEAIAFVEWLRRPSNRAPVRPSWAVDVASIESAVLQIRDPRRRCAFSWVGFLPADLLKAARAGHAEAVLTRRSRLLVWLRLGRGVGSVRRMELPIPQPWSRRSGTNTATQVAVEPP